MPYFSVQVQARVDDRVQSLNMAYDQTAGAFGGDSAQRCLLSFQARVETSLRAILGTDVRLQGYTCRQIDPLPGSTWKLAVNDLAGTGSGTAAPALSTITFNLRNSAGSLPRPGRLFLSGWPKSLLVGGQIDSAAITGALKTFSDNLLTIPAGGGSDWAGSLIVYRRYHVVEIDPGPPPVKVLQKLVPPVPVDVDSIDIATTPGRQIRRKSIMIGI